MTDRIRKELVLEGLDCANCAALIETKVNKIRGVSSASVNFLTKTLIVETEDPAMTEEIIAQTKKIVLQLEPHVLVREKIITASPKKVLLLLGLDCAGCAQKIENAVRNIEGVKAAAVDIVSRRLTIEVNPKYDMEKIKDEAARLIKKVDPQIRLQDDSPGDAAAEHTASPRPKILIYAAGAALFAVALLGTFPFWAELSLYLASYLLVGGTVLRAAAGNIIRGRVFDENFLMSIATIGAFAIGEFPEGVAVMLFYQLGEYLQDRAVNQSRKSIKALLDIKPEFAHLQTGQTVREVRPEEVNPGELIIVKPGERIPLDGKIIAGTALVDTSALTGESVPREVAAGDDVLGGFINTDGLLTVAVTKVYAESTVAKILDLVQNAAAKKAAAEKFITRFARIYTPAVVAIALALALLPPLLLEGARFSDWIYRALIFLVVSCPCALVISIPLGFFGGIGGASRQGILVKGGNYLEALQQVDTVVFDKTGTLTKGVFAVSSINPAQGYTKEELLQLAAYSESYSNHPIALSILAAYGETVEQTAIASYNEISGHGVKISLQGKNVAVGNSKLMAKEKVSFAAPPEAGTVLHVAVDGSYAGNISIADELKADAKEAVQGLQDLGIRKIAMLTGDNKATAAQVAQELGITEVHAELLPDQKVELLEQLLAHKSPGAGKIAFVGDGINDAPVLARADIGIAMGGLGSDAAIEAADVILMHDEPSKLLDAIKLARRTKAIVWQNVIFSLGIKAVVLVLGAGGLATLWEAVFADVGVALLAVLNSMRILRFKSNTKDAE